VISAVLARRYARALLDLAQRRKDLKETHGDLESVARIFERDPRVRRLFEAPNISRAEKESFLEKRWKPKLNKNVYGLMVVLLRRRRYDHLVAIAAEFRDQRSPGGRPDARPQPAHRNEGHPQPRSGSRAHWGRGPLAGSQGHRRIPRHGALAHSPEAA